MAYKKPDKICGWKTGKQEDHRPCMHGAGKGTSHKGTGRCYLHDKTRIGDAKLLVHIAADPKLVEIADIYLANPALTVPRGELALLKAELSMLPIDIEERTHISDMIKLIREIGRLSKTINEIEVGKRHYIHVNVVGQIVAAYGEIGRRYIPDEVIRARFAEEVQYAIRQSLSRSSARAIAANVIVQEQPMIIDAQPEIVTAVPEVAEVRSEGEPIPEAVIDDVFEAAKKDHERTVQNVDKALKRMKQGVAK